MEEQNNHTNSDNESRSSGCLFPAIAVVGFFVWLFLGAYIMHLTHARWLVPVTVIVALGWAFAFSMITVKKKKNSK